MPSSRSLARAAASLSELPSLLRSFVSISALATFFFLAIVLYAAAPSALAAPEKPTWAPNEVLIQFRRSASPSRVQAILADLGARRVHGFRKIRATREKISRMSVPDAVARFRNDPAVEFIEPNYVLHAVATPDDPSYPEQWALSNVGQTGGVPGADIDAKDAWDVTTGSADVLVAIIDTGIDYTHPDLARNIYVNPGEIPGNGIDDDGNGYVDDVHGWDFANGDNDPMDDNFHGTHVAGTVGAVGNNGLGVAGLAWNVRLLPLKFLNSSGAGFTSDAVLCVEYAIQTGARIMSNSWGGGYSETLREAIQSASDAGILFVAAAGNSGTDNDTSPFYPASYDVPSVISVAATDDHDQLARFSCYGATSVHLAAPGVNILSTAPNAGYRLLSGTSMATPHVSGVLALMLARHPELTAQEAKARLLAGVDRLPSLAGRVASGGRLNAFLALADPDSTPPEPITDLAVAQPLSGAAVLQWTSPADAGAVGRAERYEIYEAPFPFDGSSIGTATLSTASPTPLPAGSMQQAEVLGLAFGAPYWFAVESVDHFGNRSAISNVVSATTLGAPAAAVTPDSLQASALTGARTSASLAVANGGVGSLDFEIVGEPTVTDTLAGAPSSADGTAGGGGPSALGAGGPDRFGYRWIDSREAAGPAYDWVELSGTGTLVPINGDDITSPPLPIGFRFPFYGNEFTEFRACTNGFLSFTSSSTSRTNGPLPGGTAPVNLIAVFWDDLLFGPGSYAYYRSDGERLVVEYVNVRLFSGAGPYTFEVILDRAGGILFQYATAGGPVDGATVGIQNGAATDGLTIAFNSTYVTEHLAVRLAPSPRWLSISPERGRVFAPGSTSVRLDMDATGLGAGPHRAVLRVRTNDPARPEVDVPLVLVVTGGPDIDVSRLSLDLGGAPVGGAATDSLQVINRGTEPLQVDGMSVDSPDFVLSPATLTLSPGESTGVAVTFHPAALGPVTATLKLRSNDPDEPEFRVALSAAGVPPAEMHLTLPSLSAALANGGAETQRVSISNTGGGPLDYSARVEPAAGAPSPGSPAVLPVVLTDPVGDALRCDLTQLRGWSTGGNLMIEMDFANAIDPNDFGGYLWIDTDQNASTGTRSPFFGGGQDIGPEWEVQFNKLAFNLVVLYRAGSRSIAGSFPATVGPASIRFSLPLYALDGDDGEVNVIGLLGATVFLSEWFPNTGHATIGRVPWLSVSPASGTLAPGETATLNAAFHPGPLGPGGYDASIQLTSNDPSNPSRSLATHLDLTAAPVLVLSDSTIAFGSVYLGTSATDSVKVGNEGADTLRVSSVTADRSEVTASPRSLVLPPGGHGTISLRFAPTAVGALSAVLTLTHNSGAGVTTVPVTGEGVPPPVLAFQPSAVQFDLKEGEKSSQSLTIRNDGAGSLAWVLRPSVGPVPQPGSAQAQEAGGPDRYGYRWDDSDEPGGPTYQWVELRGVGRVLPLSGDDVTLPNVPIGFPFPFYGKEFSTINVCTNGLASFTSTAAPYAPRFLPSAEAPENLLAFFWHDLLVDSPGAVYAYSDGTRFILEFDQVRHAWFPGTASFEVILYRTGVMLCQYREILQIPAEVVGVGIQDSTKTDGFLIAPIPRPVRPGLAIRIAPAPRWLSVAPDSGQVAPSSSVSVSLAADATGSPPGDYDAHLTLRSNDPQRTAAQIPVAFRVVGVPRLLAGATSLDFGSVFLGTTAAETLAVTNVGSAPLTVSALTPSRPEYEALPASLTLAPLASAAVTVLFHSAGPAGRKDGTLSIVSNDPASPQTIGLRAEALVPPDIDVAPALIEAAVPDSGKTGKTLTVCNTGGSDLRARIGAAPPWIRVQPDSGVVAAGQCADWVVTLDAADLPAGDHSDTLVVRSNDPDEPEVRRAVLLHVGSVGAAAAEIGPATLNRDSRGRLLMAYVELPRGLDPSRVVLSSVRLNGSVPAAQSDLLLGDFNSNGVPDLQFKFNRTAVESILPPGESVPLAVTGEVRDTRWFVARDSARVLASRAAGLEGDAGPLPSVYALRENHPNPFNPMTWIGYDLPEPGRVALRVYDAQGRLIRTLVDRSEPAGQHRVAWDGRDGSGRSAASGVYFCRMRAGRFEASRRMLLLK